MNESQIPASGAAAAPDILPATPATENPAPSAQDTPAAGGTYSAPTGEPYGGYAAPASSEAFASTVIVTKKGPGWGALLGAMLLTVGLTLGALFYVRPAMLRASTPTNLNGGTVATVPASSDATDWTAVASAVSPAVVTIQAQGASSGSTGSGVIYDAQGDIVTNYHVISSVLTGGQIQVTLADGRLYAARVVGHDKTTDLAVIRLENPPADLTVARFATSANLEVGAPVMAIGAPLGLSNTVTTGIVSALNRPVEVSMDEDSTSQDQTQASSDLVVTNYHVISSVLTGGQIQVTLADGRLYTARVVGHDKTTDLAVIRLDNPPEDLTVARFTTSSTLQVGAPVMAIGAPLGLSNTVTTGIVSALNRPVEVSMDEDSTSQDQTQASSDLVITNAIQIDASINPGNSGGPLFDATGAVIGINSSIKSLATSSDGQAGSIGLGFAIPSDLVVSVADQLIATGSASHGMLGVTVKAATATVGSDTYVGAEIQEVTSGSGAAIAGLRVGDVILTVEGQEVTSPKQLVGYVRRYRAGDTVTMTIERNGQTQDVSVTIQ